MRGMTVSEAQDLGIKVARKAGFEGNLTVSQAVRMALTYNRMLKENGPELLRDYLEGK